MATSIDEAILEEIARSRIPHSSEAAENFRLGLSKSDTVSYCAFEKTLYPNEREWYNEKHRLGVVTAFKSPLYSDALKKYFAAAYLREELILSAAGEFLTEKIIFSFIEGSRAPTLSLTYFAALMGSEHLSERIVSSALLKIYEEWKVLDLIPDRMITPELMATWQCPANADGIRGIWRDSPEGKVAAGRRVKQVYSEYADFPDVWALKVFCGL